MKNIFLYAFVLLLGLQFTSCDRGGEDDALIHIYKDELTREDQNTIGNRVQEFIENDPFMFPVVERSTNASLYNYFNTLVTTLTNTTTIGSRDSINWELTILQDDDIATAFAAPGGKLFIYSGLLKFMEAEHELISLLAHEIYYVEKGIVVDYLLAEYSKDQFFLGDVLLGKDVEGIDRLCLFLRDLTYSLGEVKQADSFSIELICPFQYNSYGLKSIIERSDQLSTPIKWMEVRAGNPARMKNIEDKASFCGEEEDPTFEERYVDFIEMLP